MCRAGSDCRRASPARPAARPARRARSSSPAASDSTRTTAGPAAPRLELSYPDPNGWNVRAVNGAPATGPAADARTYAVCLGTKEGVDIRDFQNCISSKPGRDGESRQRAPRGNRSVAAQGGYVLAGGMRTVKGRSANVEMQESFPDTPSSWTVGVTNRGDKRAGDARVKLYAVCIKK